MRKDIAEIGVSFFSVANLFEKCSALLIKLQKLSATKEIFLNVRLTAKFYLQIKMQQNSVTTTKNI